MYYCFLLASAGQELLNNLGIPSTDQRVQGRSNSVIHEGFCSFDSILCPHVESFFS